MGLADDVAKNIREDPKKIPKTVPECVEYLKTIYSLREILDMGGAHSVVMRAQSTWRFRRDLRDIFGERQAK